MPGYLLTQGPKGSKGSNSPIASCPHGSGQVSMITPNYNVKILGQPVATLNAHQRSVAGCRYTVGTKDQPCKKVQWETAQNVKVNNQPVMLQTPLAQCYSEENAFQGFVIWYVGQTNVRGV